MNGQEGSFPAGAAAESVPALLLRLEHDVADILTGEASEYAMYAELLEAIGTALRWPVGAVWQVQASSEVHCVATWSESEFGGAPFVEETRTATLASGVGLPGRVWRSGRPAWITDVVADQNFPRAAPAARAGLHTAFCFPLRSGDGIEGLAEFYSPHRMKPSPELLATMSSLGSRIGDALRRQRVDRAVRLSEARLRAVLAAALDAVVIADANGVVLEFNPAACATFGYPRDHAVGREVAELIIPPDLRELHREGLARYLQTEQPRVLDRRIEIAGMRADGSVFPVELTITRIAVAGNPVFAGHLRDLSEKRRADEELNASRARIVAAADDSRRRIERDLHDGAQQRLTAVALQLRTAAGDATADSVQLREELVRAANAVAASLEELREIAHGIHPAILSEGGLKPALRGLARRSAVAVELEISSVQRWPERIEATAYYVVSELLANAAKHARASVVRVAVDQANEVLHLSIRDDGVGGADPSRGSGLIGLRDRVEALGGTIVVESPAGAGTAVHVSMPLD